MKDRLSKLASEAVDKHRNMQKSPFHGKHGIETGMVDTRGGDNVLLIEEEASVRKVIKIMLERLGFNVITAKNGKESIELFKIIKKYIQLVICDSTMTSLNGWQTIAALHRLRADIPVILTSGYDEEKIFSQRDSDLHQTFLQKPFNKETLKNVLAKILARAS